MISISKQTLINNQRHSNTNIKTNINNKTNEEALIIFIHVKIIPSIKFMQRLAVFNFYSRRMANTKESVNDFHLHYNDNSKIISFYVRGSFTLTDSRFFRQLKATANFVAKNRILQIITHATVDILHATVENIRYNFLKIEILQSLLFFDLQIIIQFRN